MKHFTALVRKAKFAFNKTLASRLKCDLKADVSYWTYLAYGVDSGNRIHFKPGVPNLSLTMYPFSILTD